MTLTAADVIRMFEATGGFLRGHFALTSGAHSSGYVQSSQILGRPDFAEPLAEELARRFREAGATCVVGPALGGAVLAYAVGRLLGIRVVYAERVQGILGLARGYQVDSADRVLIIEDVLITGRTIEETIEIVRLEGAAVVGVGVILDRSRGRVQFGVRTERLATYDFDVYPPEDCPLCRANVPLRRPRFGRV
jgi:orotate phosphoribosyltransferase